MTYDPSPVFTAVGGRPFYRLYGVEFRYTLVVEAAGERKIPTVSESNGLNQVRAGKDKGGINRVIWEIPNTS